MIDPVTGYALLKGGTAIGKWLVDRYNQGRNNFENTAYAKRLKTLMSQGAISPEAKYRILNKTSTIAGQQTAGNLASLKGTLANRGTLGSISGQRALGDIRSRGDELVFNKAADINLKNELTKNQAADTYARAKTGYTERLNQLKSQNTSELWGGLLGAAGTYASGKIQEKSMAGLDINDPASWSNWISQQPDQQAALKTIQSLTTSKYYGRDVGGSKSKVDLTKMYGMNYDEARQFYLDHIFDMSQDDIRKVMNYLDSRISK